MQSSEQQRSLSSLHRTQGIAESACFDESHSTVLQNYSTFGVCFNPGQRQSVQISSKSHSDHSFAYQIAQIKASVVDRKPDGKLGSATAVAVTHPEYTRSSGRRCRRARAGEPRAGARSSRRGSVRANEPRVGRQSRGHLVADRTPRRATTEPRINGTCPQYVEAAIIPMVKNEAVATIHIPERQDTKIAVAENTNTETLLAIIALTQAEVTYHQVSMICPLCK